MNLIQIQDENYETFSKLGCGSQLARKEKYTLSLRNIHFDFC